MKKHSIKCLYSESVYLLTGLDHAEYVEFLHRHYPRYKLTGAGVGSGRMEDPIDNDGVQFVYMWVDETLAVEDQRLVAIHEAAHAVMTILDDAGVPISKENDEAFTYLLEDICKQLFQKLKI